MILMGASPGEREARKGLTPFIELLLELKDQAGSWRNMSKIMHRKTGEHVSNVHLAEMHDFGRPPTFEVVRKIAGGFPDYAEELFRAAGFPVPEEFIPQPPPDVVEANRIRAEWISAAVETLARRRNLATADVIYTLLVEDLERTKPPEEPA